MIRNETALTSGYARRKYDGFVYMNVPARMTPLLGSVGITSLVLALVRTALPQINLTLVLIVALEAFLISFFALDIAIEKWQYKDSLRVGEVATAVIDKLLELFQKYDKVSVAQLHASLDEDFGEDSFMIDYVLDELQRDGYLKKVS